MKRPLVQRCAAIDLLLLDVDGVLTDGTINYTDNGVELKRFHVRDGSGLKLWHLAGKQSAIVSGRSSEAVVARAAELGVRLVIQGAGDKRQAYRHVLEQTGMQSEQVCCMGDDIPDLPLLLNCGLAAAVADACPDVIQAAHWVARNPGGRGAVREVIELLLRCQGRWHALLQNLVHSG